MCNQMVAHGGVVADAQERTSLALHALADATRRDILARTLGREQSISTLAGAYPMTFAAVQKHVGVLERAGLVTKHRRGREQLVRGEIDALREARRALQVLEDVWRTRLEQFGDVLAELTTHGPQPSREPDPHAEPDVLVEPDVPVEPDPLADLPKEERT
jgi:DNA-binding transcriptional ArsR family regulator